MDMTCPKYSKIIWFTFFEVEIEMCQSQKRGSTHSPGTIQAPQCQARRAQRLWRSAANVVQVSCLWKQILHLM